MAGYDWNKGMSNNAVAAYAKNEKPLSKWTKTELLKWFDSAIENPSEYDLKYYGDFIADAETWKQKFKKMPLNLLRKILLEKTSYHHTSKYYNITNFYSLADLDTIYDNLDKENLLENYYMAEKKNTEKLDKFTVYINAFKVAGDELSKQNLDTNDNGIPNPNKPEEKDEDLTPGQKSLVWERRKK